MSDATEDRTTLPAAKVALACKALVRDLAATPVLDSDEAGRHLCVLCDAWSEPGVETVHDPTCLWRRARELFPDA
jgi:hypothetical protein